MSLPLAFSTVLEGSQNSGKFLCLLVYYIMKDTDEQPDEEVHRTGSRKVLGAGGSVSMRLGIPILQVCGCVCQPGSSLNLYL